MKKVDYKTHNKDLIERMKKGESLLKYDTGASWYPVRPVIKKDVNAIKKLYDKKEVDEEIVIDGETRGS
jgi:hypothetical protein